MPTTYRVLVIDDSDKDALPVARTLRKQWPALTIKRVDSAAAISRAGCLWLTEANFRVGWHLLLT